MRCRNRRNWHMSVFGQNVEGLDVGHMVSDIVPLDAGVTVSQSEEHERVVSVWTVPKYDCLFFRQSQLPDLPDS